MPIRILIADDNSSFRRVLRRLLEKSATRDIVEAEDGQQAVSKALELRPDVIVLDLAMPVKDGLTAAREISASLPQTPILMCTLHMSPQVEVEAQKAGVRRVLSKSESSLLVLAAEQLLAAATPSEPVAPSAIPPPVLAAVPASPPVAVQPADNTLSAELPIVPTDPKSTS